MQVQVTGDDGSGAQSSIFNEPDHVLSFVLHALESSVAPVTRSSSQAQMKGHSGLSMDDLRIISDDGDEVGDEDTVQDDGDPQDSDDEDVEVPGVGKVQPDEEMTATALNLLLSILEGNKPPTVPLHALTTSTIANPDISTMNTPLLTSILPHVGRLSAHTSDTLRRLAREARMVLTVREASSSISSSSRHRASADHVNKTVQQTYQKALKLLQDPILPVRAHGLLLLRRLVSHNNDSVTVEVVRPLVSAILDIFLQSVQDDDSYVFLNAVQGLSALVDGHGLEVLRSLVRVYTSGLQGSGSGAMEKTELDVKVRVGEALGQIIRRYGDALPIYGVYTPLLVGQIFSDSSV